jgi:hypothetical protein
MRVMHRWELAEELGAGTNLVSAEKWILKIEIETTHRANIISLIDL